MRPDRSPESTSTRAAPRTAAVLGALLLVLVYPLAVEHALARVGVRVTAAVLLAAGLLSSARFGRERLVRGLPTRSPTLFRVAILGILALAFVTGAPTFLRLVPAALQAGLCVLFVASLRGGGSLFEAAARILEPHAPDFIRSYCRKATLCFAALFAAQATALAALAVDPPDRGLATTTSALIWLPLLALSAGEWMVRKAWFRHYGSHPLDQLLRVLLPPERTARGRRSLAHVEQLQRDLGVPPQ